MDEPKLLPSGKPEPKKVKASKIIGKGVELSPGDFSAHIEIDPETLKRIDDLIKGLRDGQFNTIFDRESGAARDFHQKEAFFFRGRMRISNADWTGGITFTPPIP